MECKYCGEKDESKLIMSSRVVNGIVRHEWLCFRCFWLEKFKAEEDGILREGKTVESRIPARTLNTLSLRE